MPSDYKDLRTLEERATVRAAADECAAEGFPVLSMKMVVWTPKAAIARVISLAGRVLWLVSGPAINAVVVFRTLGAARRFLRGAA